MTTAQQLAAIRRTQRAQATNRTARDLRMQTTSAFITANEKGNK